jgi:Type II secretion system (T2SS), protein M
MTTRDRIVILVVLLAAALGGTWFVGLAPKHKQIADLQAQIDTEQQRLTDAQQRANAARQAKSRYRTDYAAVATLGKAVPKSDALPSLVYQLQSAAHDSRIDFRSVKVAATGGQGPTPAPPAATAAASGGTSASSGGSSSSGSSKSSSSSSSSSSTTPPSSTPAPATQAASATLPPGATVGSAGFPTMPFAFIFDGTFFDMERFMHEVQGFVRVKGKNVDVRGRLLSIDGFSLSAGPNGFPSVKATIAATAYLLSPDETTAPTTSTSSPSASSSSGSGGGSAAPSSAGAAASEVAR